MVINNKVYDTKTAKLIGEANGVKLYQKKTGEFFLTAIEKKPVPMSYIEARGWTAKNLPRATYDKIFGEIENNDTKQRINLNLSISAIEQAKRAAAKQGISMSALIEKLIKEDIVMKKEVIKVTIVKTIIKSNQFEAMTAIGYNEQDARQAALKELMYSCCKDFTRPSSCMPGTVVQYGEYDAVEIIGGEDEDTLADGLEWDSYYTISFEGKDYLINDDSCNKGNEIISDEICKLSSWSEF